MFTLFMLKIGMALGAILCLFIGMFLLLRAFDYLLGINFRKAFDTIESNPVAMALYYGLRLLGVSIAIGLVVCVALIM
jgi:hypothetical protein